MVRSRSKTATLTPDFFRPCAKVRPPMPPPIMRTCSGAGTARTMELMAGCAVIRRLPRHAAAPRTPDCDDEQAKPDRRTPAMPGQRLLGVFPGFRIDTVRFVCHDALRFKQADL